MPAMKFDIISDIHLTSHRDHGDQFIAEWEPKADWLILAGDVAEFHWWESAKGYYLMKELCDKYGDVVFVPGNHDYYGATFEHANARFKDLSEKIDNFHFLNGDDQIHVEWINPSNQHMDGVTIYGATLWFPYDPENPIYAKYLSDFHYIKGFVPKVYDVNRDHVAYLNNVLGDPAKSIVVTHHMPSWRSVHPKYNGDNLNRFFVSDVEEIMWRRQPTIWVHGHTHEKWDYMIDKTRVVCNPKGYRGEKPGPYGPMTVEV